VFVSYKYADSDVRQFINLRHKTTVRDYVNKISNTLDRSNGYNYRGENDREDLSDLDYRTIERKLADRMFYTSVTIVLISPKMFENVQEIEQWIPWEISYSLKNKTRADGSSNMNAILAVVLPDRNGSYNYAVKTDGRHIFVRKKAFFEIMLVNMFNRKGISHFVDGYGNPMYVHGNSYIVLTRWCEFCSNPNRYINLALRNRGEWNQFDIVKKIDERWVS